MVSTSLFILMLTPRITGVRQRVRVDAMVGHSSLNGKYLSENNYS